MTKISKENLTNEKVDLSEIKEELNNYIDIKIKKSIDEELEKTNRRIIKSKNLSLFAKNIIIIILIIIIAYLSYLLYSIGYFDHNNEQNNKSNNNPTSATKENETSHEPTLEELKEIYGKLLDNIVINEKCAYLEDYYNGNLTSELKNYLVLNTVDFSTLTVEDDYNVIDESSLKNNYNKIFTGEYKSISFDYNDNKIRYINKLSSYITDSILEKNNSNIKRDIIDIKVLDEEVNITTIEGLIKDDKLYNIISNEEIKEYNNGNLNDYEESLNKIVYTFKNSLLIKISK